MEILTAAASEAQQRRVAGALRARGLRPGDRVALCTSSSAAMLSCILGALRTGIVPVVLNSSLLDHERHALLDDADPQLVVDDALLETLFDGPAVELAPYPLARPMHYTSGTTGRPKGVWSGLLDEADARQLVDEERELWHFEPSDRHLVCSPFHHSVAIRFGGGTLLAGGELIVLGRFEAAVALRAIDRLRPTTTFMVPAHLQRLFSAGGSPDLSCFRLLAHAGAPCPEPLKLAAIDAFGVDTVWEFYGSTEGQFSACSSREWLDRRGTVGRARPGRRLSIDDGGVVWCEVPRHARWEYWRDPARTALAWKGGAFTVGDLGRLDGDGYLYLDGRRDDLIISGGVNVYPVEVEQVLAQAPGVEQIAVFGVADERWGQRVCAAVVGDVDPGELSRFARSRLAAYKCPKQYLVVDELPYTASGKLRRSTLAVSLGLESEPPAGAAGATGATATPPAASRPAL
ncbi:class I adenylate-forming enzyme family protein [Rhabdothermincola sediminis]|uniref:class I adenylate-forming enzyme family protein n=1 Tax=Rhabdothermincola sediminis TaxID=2751370 RepID=UPI001AA021D6|nr:AMP-binding protein [Rhabdothermincola sediminis]